jgi:hypothetical protein
MDSLGLSCYIMSLLSFMMFPISGMSFLPVSSSRSLLSALTLDTSLYSPSITVSTSSTLPPHLILCFADMQRKRDHLRRLPNPPRAIPKPILPRRKPRQRRRPRPNRRRPNILHNVPNLFRMVNNPRSFLRNPPLRNGRILNRWTLFTRWCWITKRNARSTTR